MKKHEKQNVEDQADAEAEAQQETDLGIEFQLQMIGAVQVMLAEWSPDVGLPVIQRHAEKVRRELEAADEHDEEAQRQAHLEMLTVALALAVELAAEFAEAIDRIAKQKNAEPPKPTIQLPPGSSLN